MEDDDILLDIRNNEVLRILPSEGLHALKRPHAAAEVSNCREPTYVPGLIQKIKGTIKYDALHKTIQKI